MFARNRMIFKYFLKEGESGESANPQVCYGLFIQDLVSSVSSSLASSHLL